MPNSTVPDVPPPNSKPTFTDFVRGVTRPVLTIIGLLAWIMFITDGVNYPPMFEYAVLGMIATWFGEKLIPRIQG